ncbi:M28 family peptidase [Cellulophaga baltica]|uniref:M28 family metallopeptidase n=1 Tax=Cellulophaga TaxID=104264 RepID=UPI001C074129|nr:MULTISPECIES: M28 family peptidase [Cellulophaga]MBU2997171.1 M28 family peptidase [Cellulophaga baltica]MDO6768569.1 M28 family peptidase [Cellulophaga sp. 1_MG-2023]
MKTLICTIPLALFLSCGTVKMKETNLADITPVTEKEKVTPVAISSNEVQFSSSDRIEELMSFLASDDLEGRDSGSEGIEKAANFIENIFKENNVKPYFKIYKDTLSNYNKTSYNVVGVIEGNDPVLKNEVIIIGAHYDHIGHIKAVNGDDIANGANDNASGTSTVLELARYFGNTKTNKRTLIFSLFSAEEKGLLGSKHLSKKLKEENLDLYVMLNFEMVGVPLVNKSYTMYLTGYEESNMAAIANKYAKGKLVGFLPEAKKYNLFKRSDNYPFYSAFNVPSQTFCTFDFTNFNHYHGVDDEVELMDFSFIAGLVNKVIPMVEGITNAPTKEIKF